MKVPAGTVKGLSVVEWTMVSQSALRPFLRGLPGVVIA
jgi:hypothetical protein